MRRSPARDHDVIRATLACGDLDAEFVPQRHYYDAATVPVGWQAGNGGYEEGEPYPGFVDVFCRRLFRNRPWLRFEKPVHEELLSNDPSRPLRQRRGEWVIHHFGKLVTRERLREKGRATCRFGRQKAALHPATRRRTSSSVSSMPSSSGQPTPSPASSGCWRSSLRSATRCFGWRSVSAPLPTTAAPSSACVALDG